MLHKEIIGFYSDVLRDSPLSPLLLILSLSILGVWHYDLISTLPSDAHFDHLDESFADVLSLLGRGLKVQHVIILLAPGSRFVAVHLSLRLSVHLVADENEWEILGIVRSCIFNEALLPLIESVKTGSVRQIKSESAAISTSIEGES